MAATAKTTTTTTISSALAVVLLCLCIMAAAFLPTDAAAAAVSHNNQSQSQQHGHDVGDDLVATACKKASGHEAHHYHGLGLTALTTEFCETALRSDKRVSGAAGNDTRSLALVGMDLVSRAAAVADAKVRSALRYAKAGAGKGSKASRDTEYSLRYCVMDYDTVALVVPACRAIVQEFNPAEFQVPFDYLECANRVMDAAGDCWNRVSYEDGGLKKVLWNHTVEVANLANLAQAMVEQMVDFHDDD